MEFVSTKKQDVMWINPRPPPAASTTQAAEAENLKTQSSTSNFDKYGDDLLKGMHNFLNHRETEDASSIYKEYEEKYEKIVKRYEGMHKFLRLDDAKTDLFDYDSSIYNEYEEKYKEIVERYEGFITIPCPIFPKKGIILPLQVGPTVEKAANFAVEKHNEMTGENIILLIAVNANLQLRHDARVLYMTLKTLDGDQMVYKEAKVCEYFGIDRPIELNIFRNAIYYDKIKGLESDLGGNADSSTEGSARRSPCATAFYSWKPWQTSEPNSYDKAGEKRRRLNKGQDEESEFSAALKAHPVSCLGRRIQSDIKQAFALVRNLDIGKGIEDNIMCNINFYGQFNSGYKFQVLVVKCITGERVLYGIQLLDTLLAYLWRVHGVNYYGMIESDEPKGFRHVRPDDKNYEETSESGAKGFRHMWLDGKDYGESGAEWEKKLDTFWQKRLSGPHDMQGEN